ncbi:hypothetical protein [Actinophytocola sp.]|uniref:hypothetical protein n=1 Tax=Actinophytocola sp. TaxID=1872138 RepID=UPI002ED12EF5
MGVTRGVGREFVGECGGGGSGGVFAERVAAEVVGSRLSGYGSRTGCGSTVTYFWVRVYEHIPWWPDGERAVAGATYFQNGGLTARGSCDGRGDYYTHVSTATGASGESRESLRNTIC